MVISKILFQDRATHQGSAADLFHQLSQLPYSKLSQQHKSWLLQPFTNNEIENVIKEAQQDSAPGSDGFTYRFYEHFWKVIGSDVGGMVLL